MNEAGGDGEVTATGEARPGAKKIDLSSQVFFERTFYGHKVKKMSDGITFDFVYKMCKETKMPDNVFKLLEDNHVHDDNVECINW